VDQPRPPVLRPIEADEVRREIARFAAAGVDAIDVCLVYSRRYQRTSAVTALAGREFPGIAVS
jgi:hypothetical protein